MLAEGLVIEAPYILAVFAGAGGVVAVLFRLLISSKDTLIASNEKAFGLILAAKEAELDEQRSMKESYQDIAKDAVASATATTNFYRQKYENRPPLLAVAPVIPESHSPSTPIQREQASIATMRAAMESIKLATGQEPRPEPPHAGVNTGLPSPRPGGLAEAIAAVPEQTAELVVEKLEKKNEEAHA